MPWAHGFGGVTDFAWSPHAECGRASSRISYGKCTSFGGGRARVLDVRITHPEGDVAHGFRFARRRADGGVERRLATLCRWRGRPRSIV